MEDNLSTAEPGSQRDCANCGQPAMEGDHRTSLCSDCREQFTRLNIPVWIRLFAGGIAVLVLFSLFTLPRSISLGVHLEKAKKAEREKKFFTAEKELSKVLEKVPGNVEANGYMLMATFYNQDYEGFNKQVKSMQHMVIEDKQLSDELDELMGKALHYVSNDSFEVFTSAFPPREIPDTAWDRYLRHQPEDVFAMTGYASLLFDRKEYPRCDSLLQKVLQVDNEYFPALMLEASTKREEGDPGAALVFNDRIMKINRESVYGISSKARTLLRLKKDGEALDIVSKGYELNDKNLYLLSTLALAYHFSGRTAERDAMLKKAWPMARDASDSVTVQYAVDVINKKEKFRD